MVSAVARLKSVQAMMASTVTTPSAQCFPAGRFQIHQMIRMTARAILSPEATWIVSSTWVSWSPSPIGFRGALAWVAAHLVRGGLVGGVPRPSVDNETSGVFEDQEQEESHPPGACCPR